MSGRKIALATFAVMAIHMFCRLLGFIEKQVLAHYFGAGAETDAYFTALSVVMAVYLVVEGLLTHTFIPAWNRAAGPEGDEKRGWRLVSLTAGIVFVLTAFVVGAGLLLAPQIVARLVGKGPVESAVSLTRITLPSLLFLTLSSLTYVVLNARKSFALPAAGDAALKLGTILGIVFLGRRLGISGIAFGFLLGSALKLGVHLWGLRDRLSLLRLEREMRYPPLAYMGALMLPLLVGNLFSQIRPLADVFLANRVAEGGLSTLRYARSIVDIPVQVFPYALGIAVFPFLSEWAVRNDQARLRQAFSSAMRMMTFVFLPLMVGVILLRQPVVGLLFGHGRFDAQAVAATSSNLAWYSLGLPAFAFEIIVLQFFFAFADTRTPTILGIAGLFVHILAALLLIPWLGQGGIALAMTISKTLKVAVLLLILQNRGRLIPWRELLWHGARVALAAAVMLAAIILGNGMLSRLVPGVGLAAAGSLSGRAASLALITAWGAAVFLASALLLRLEEPALLKRLIAGKIGGAARG